jgi:predicted acylesterase/phospholipase RssA
MTWRALALSGGGTTGEFQIGVFQVMKTLVDRFDFICGNGVGSLNSSILVQHDSFKDAATALESVWAGIRGNTDLYEVPFGGEGLATLGALISDAHWARNSAYTTKATRALIDRHVDWKRVQDKQNWAFGITSLSDGTFYPVTNHRGLLERFYATHERRIRLSLDPNSEYFIGSRIHDLLHAGATVPFFFPPITIFDHRFCEGGIRDYAPVALAVTAYQLELERNPGVQGEIIVVSNEPGVAPYAKGDQLDSGREILARTIRIMTREMFANDVEGARARVRETPGASVKFTILEPDKDVGLQALDFNNHKGRKELRDNGVQVAWRILHG